MKLLALAVALLLAPSVASADDYSLEMWLSWYNGIHVAAPEDAVEDGCWPSPAGTKAAVEKELLSLNVPLGEIETGFALIMVKGMGWTTRKQGEGNCVVKHTLQLVGPGGPEGGYSVPLAALPMAGLYTTPKNESQAHIDQSMKGFATQIAVAWAKSRPIRETRDKKMTAMATEAEALRDSLPEDQRGVAGNAGVSWSSYIRLRLATATVFSPE